MATTPAELIIEMLDPTGSTIEAFRVALTEENIHLLLSQNTSYPIRLRARVVQNIELASVEMRPYYLEH